MTRAPFGAAAGDGSSRSGGLVHLRKEGRAWRGRGGRLLCGGCQARAGTWDEHDALEETL